MSLIVEDGTVVFNALSYLSVADADAYHGPRANTNWFLMTELEKEGCLVRATDYMTQKYRMKWKGYRYSSLQALDWPRTGVVMEDLLFGGSVTLSYESVPAEVKNACAELALRASIATLSEDLSPRVTQETIGPITVKYDPNSSPVISYVQVDNILKPYLNANSGNAMVKLSRC